MGLVALPKVRGTCLDLSCSPLPNIIARSPKALNSKIRRENLPPLCSSQDSLSLVQLLCKQVLYHCSPLLVRLDRGENQKGEAPRQQIN